MSTPPVLPPMPEQAAPADIEMAVAEPEVGDILGEAELMFGKPERYLMLAEEIRYQELKKQWDKQEQQTKIAEYNVKLQKKQNEKREKAARLAKEHNQQREKSAHLAQEQDAQLQAQEKVSDDGLAQQ